MMKGVLVHLEAFVFAVAASGRRRAGTANKWLFTKLLLPILVFSREIHPSYSCVPHETLDFFFFCLHQLSQK